MRKIKYFFLKILILTTLIYGSLFYFISFSFEPKPDSLSPNIYFLGSILNKRDVQTIAIPEYSITQTQGTRAILEQRKIDDFNSFFLLNSEKKPPLSENIAPLKTSKKTHKQWTLVPMSKETSEDELPLETIGGHIPLKLPDNVISY